MIPWLSRKSRCPAQAPLTEQLANAMRGRAKRVLFLEDDRLWRELVGVVASDFDLELVEATNTTDAMNQLAQGGQFDAAILDVGVANGNGIEMYRWIKAAFPKLHVVFLTGSQVETVADRIHAVGSAPVYFKPAVMTVSFLSDLIEKMGARKRCPV